MLGPHVTTKYVDTICDLLNIYIYMYIYICMYVYIYGVLREQSSGLQLDMVRTLGCSQRPRYKKWLAILYLNLVGETMCQTGI